MIEPLTLIIMHFLSNILLAYLTVMNRVTIHEGSRIERLQKEAWRQINSEVYSALEAGHEANPLLYQEDVWISIDCFRSLF
jgi:hypothetical protein